MPYFSIGEQDIIKAFLFNFRNRFLAYYKWIIVGDCFFYQLYLLLDLFICISYMLYNMEEVLWSFKYKMILYYFTSLRHVQVFVYFHYCLTNIKLNYLVRCLRRRIKRRVTAETFLRFKFKSNWNIEESNLRIKLNRFDLSFLF